MCGSRWWLPLWPSVRVAKPRRGSRRARTIADSGLDSMAGGRSVALWVGAVAALLAAGGGAGADDLFTIGGVRVDRSAASAQQARDAAIAEAERKAFDLLIRRLTDPAQAAALARPADRDLAALVQGFQVEQERAAGTRYVA